MELVVGNGKLTSKFLMKYNKKLQTVFLYATIKGNIATGTIKYDGNKFYYMRWSLINNNKIEGVYAATRLLLDSSDKMDFTATRKKKLLSFIPFAPRI